MPTINNRPAHESRILRLIRFVAVWLALAEIFSAHVCRGQSALEKWKTEMTLKGDTFEAAKLWPPISPASLEFTNRLHESVKAVPREWLRYGALLKVFVTDSPGEWRRGSQEPQPVFWHDSNAANTWEKLEAMVPDAEPALKSLRELMRNPPAGIPYDIKAILDGGPFPNFIDVRLGAHALAAAVMRDLHIGNLDDALENLVALNGFARLYNDNPSSVVSMMIRMATLNLSTDLTWDALQSEDWTDARLVKLQESRIDTMAVLAQMPRAFEGERYFRLQLIDRFKSRSYRDYFNWAKGPIESFGYTLTEPPLWREYLFHPVWSIAWADDEALEYLRRTEPELDALRETAKSVSFHKLSAQLNALHEHYKPPEAGWRFYFKLPGEEFPDVAGKKFDQLLTEYPYSDFRRAWSATMSYLTRNEMVRAAIAVKRYELRYGKSPTSLEALVPTFLKAVPRDLMDGQPLHCRLMPDQTFAIYSVGSDFVDDGGSPMPKTPPAGNRAELSSPWEGVDWVWRQAVQGSRVIRTGTPGSSEN